MNNTKMFFIVGTGRCGTQMLADILGIWPNIKTLRETHFIVPLYEKYMLNYISVDNFFEVVDETYKSDGDQWIKDILKDAGANLKTYKSDFIDYVRNNEISGNIKIFIESFFEFLYGKNYIFVDKTPHYGTRLEIINKIWPNAKVIHLIRDGIDAAESMRKHLGFIKVINGDIKPIFLTSIKYKYKPEDISNEPPSMIKTVRFWEAVISETDKNIKKCKNENTITVKYEDILFKTSYEIKNIVTFLNIQSNNKILRRAITFPRPFPEKKQIRKISIEDYHRYYNLISNTMKMFGYPYDYPNKRRFLNIIYEMYRGRYYYLKKTYSFCKNIIKNLCKKINLID